MHQIGSRIFSFLNRRRFNNSSVADSFPDLIPVNEELVLCNSAAFETEEQHQNIIAQLLKPHYAAQAPVILRQAATRQKAFHLWNDLKYLEHQVGEETPVQVEIGPSYGEGVVKSTIRFGDYIQYVQLVEKQLIMQANDSISTRSAASSYELVYMAQHEMIPILSEDITLPYLCYSTKYDGLGHGKLYSSLFWFGPSGCKSSLHYDPCDNVLMQFVGRKKVILYPPQPGAKLGRGFQHKGSNKDWYYSGTGFGQQYNTSPVDVECPDLNKHPLFRQAPPGQVGLLFPGDILFIPKKWWHFLRAIDTSVSVNVWWR
jgi:hypothetical protein